MRSLFIVIILTILVFPAPASALLPPDVIFSVGSTVIQFFSIAALVVASVFSSLVITARNWLLLSRQNLLLILSCIVVLTVAAVAIVYISELHKQEAIYQTEVARLQSQNNGLQQILASHVPKSDYQSLLDRLFTAGPASFISGVASSSASKHFYGDFILLYGEVDGEPFAVEMDFNRQEEGSGIFNHYTFLDGSVGGEFFSEYDLVYATTTELQTNTFVDSIKRTYASDLSPRDVYEGTVTVLDRPLSFRVEDLYGDFITRNRASYIQYQSIGKATVTYEGTVSTVHALVEGLVSTDYSKHIFFPGRDTLDSKTYQFLLWDEAGNFYAIDSTSVFSDTPQYPAHTWVLFKSVDGKVEKRFAADITSRTDEQGTVTWSLAIPLHNSTFTLNPTRPFKQATDNRFRSIIAGVVTDEVGERKIGGILHLVE